MNVCGYLLVSAKQRKSDGLELQDLSNTLWAYGTLKHKRNEHMRAINWEVMRQIEWFSPQGAAHVDSTYNLRVSYYMVL